MRFRKEAIVGVGAVLALQIPLTMLAITLLIRMGPAIERLLEDNVYSAEAVEEMAAVLALYPLGGPPAEVPVAFDRALDRAATNITEVGEGPLLETIRAGRAAAFAGDARARAEVVEALRELGEVNRQSMARADRQIQRLAHAGAWAAAMLGAAALGLGIIVYRRLRLRLELPIHELRETTARIRAGNTQARYSASAGPREIRETATDLNWLLDRWLRTASQEGRGEQSRRDVEIRRTLGWFLDRQGHPTVVVDAAGRRVAASSEALALASPAERRRPDAEPDTEAPGSEPSRPEGEWETHEIPGTSLRILERIDAEPEQGS